jgi:hypothetical protein
MVLLIGVGFNRLPDEDAVIEKLRNSVSKEGLYFFPICLRVSRWPNPFRRLRELPPDMMVEPRGYRLA